MGLFEAAEPAARRPVEIEDHSIVTFASGCLPPPSRRPSYLQLHRSWPPLGWTCATLTQQRHGRTRPRLWAAL